MEVTLFVILVLIILVWFLLILPIVISEIKANNAIEITTVDEVRIEPLKNSNKLYTPEQVKINEIINIINHDYQEDKK
jgi:hypothetical protein